MLESEQLLFDINNIKNNEVHVLIVITVGIVIDDRLSHTTVNIPSVAQRVIFSLTCDCTNYSGTNYQIEMW